MNKSEWTTDLPQENGWYWVNANVGPCSVKFILLVSVIDGLPYGLADGKTPSRENIEYITHWLGPLPIPENPE